MERVPTTVWRISPALVLGLEEHFGAPVDSYVNGSQTWLVGDATDTERDGRDSVVIEFRLHPVAGYRMPSGCSPYDVWESVVTQLTADADPQALRLGDEVRPLTGLWDGLEAFPAYGDEIEPAQLARLVTDLLGVEPDYNGLVDHEAIGDAWERANGKVSIVALLVEELKS